MRIVVKGHAIHYLLEGPSTAPVVMLSHALATNCAMWDAQATLLSQNYHVLRYDVLGHGGTEAPRGPYTIDQLANQAADLLRALGIKKVHFLGLSMGGMIGQALALGMPDAVESLLLCDTSSRIPPEAQPLWQERIRIAESEGMAPLVEPTIVRWFTSPFRAAHPEVVDRIREMIRTTPVPGYVACCQAISLLSLTDRIHAIKVPTRIIVGEEDPGTPLAMSRTMQGQIAGAELVTIPSASHLSNLEQPEAFNLAVTSFLQRIAQARSIPDKR